MIPRWFVILFAVEFALATIAALLQKQWGVAIYFSGGFIINIGVLLMTPKL